MEKPIKSIWIILVLIIFFPVGIGLMWMKSAWSKRTKWIVTAFFAGIVLLSIIGNSTTSTSNTRTVSTTSAQNKTVPTTTSTPVSQGLVITQLE